MSVDDKKTRGTRKGENMEYRLDKRSGNELSVLGMGCMRLPRKGAGIDMQLTELILLEAFERGVNYFDTAYSYGGSEEALGEVVERNSLREHVHIASKLPHGKCRTIDDVERLFSTSLERLRTDYLDYYLIHNIVTASQWQRLVDLGIEEWIAQKKESGAIRRIGFSFHGGMAEFRALLDAYDWDLVQIQYNYVNEHYQAGREGSELAASRGIPVVVMEPLLGGRLVAGLPEGTMHAFESTAPGRSPASWGLRWLFDQPQVTVVLSGMNSVEMLHENIDTASSTAPGSMTEREHAAIREAKAAFEESFKVPCTGCNYCMPCPQGISIPSLFAAYNESFSLGWRTGFFHYMMSVGITSGAPRLATSCVECGACVKKCPQHIEIPERMADVTRRLQPPGVKTAVKIAGPILSRW